MDKPERKAGKRRSGKQAAKKRESKDSSPSLQSGAPRNDAQSEFPSGIADQAEMERLERELSPRDRKMFKQVMKSLTAHLGSAAAARLWLTSPETGFETTALDAIRNGQVQIVLATLQAQWGPSPTYA